LDKATAKGNPTYPSPITAIREPAKGVKASILLTSVLFKLFFHLTDQGLKLSS